MSSIGKELPNWHKTQDHIIEKEKTNFNPSDGLKVHQVIDPLKSDNQDHIYSRNILNLTAPSNKAQEEKLKKTILPQNRAITPLVSSSSIIDVVLPKIDDDLVETLFFLHRQIESQYSSLPWNYFPVHEKQIISILDKAENNNFTP